MNNVYVGAVAGLVLVVAAAASAAEEAAFDRDKQISQVFDALDTNDDGRIDAKEAAAESGLNRNFERLAPEGALSEEQFANWYRQYDQPAAE